MTPWFHLQRTGSEARVVVSGEIVGFVQSGADAVRLLDGVTRADVTIDSWGGSTIDALALYDRLRQIEANVLIRHAGSAAAILACAGRRVSMAATGHVMLHGPIDFCGGPPALLRRHALELDSVIGRLTGILCDKTAQPSSVVTEWLSGERDVYFTAQEARAVGLVDEVVPPAPCTFPGPLPAMAAASATQEEVALTEMLQAFGPLPVVSRQRFCKALTAYVMANVKEVNV